MPPVPSGPSHSAKMIDRQQDRTNAGPRGPAFLFDLDGTLVDSVYQHVLAWREALQASGFELAVWRIHRRIGMSGGLLSNALLRETGHRVSAEEAEHLQRLHTEAYAKFGRSPAPANCWPICLRLVWRSLLQPADGKRAPA